MYGSAPSNNPFDEKLRRELCSDFAEVCQRSPDMFESVTERRNDTSTETDIQTIVKAIGFMSVSDTAFLLKTFSGASQNS